MQNLQPYLILGAMALIGFVSHNNTVAWSAVLLMLLKVVLPQDKLLFFGGHGLNWGVIVLTAAMLTPIATGKLGIADILNVFKTPMGIASLLMGCIVALFGRWGAELNDRRSGSGGVPDGRDHHRGGVLQGSAGRSLDCQRDPLLFHEGVPFFLLKNGGCCTERATTPVSFISNNPAKSRSCSGFP